MNALLITFVILLVVYSLLWFAAYRFLTTERPMSVRYHSTPIETTTADERARGVSSFEIARGRQFGITRAGFFSLVIIGYFALAVAFAIAFSVLRSSTT
jgi:hypothetical protein